MKYNIGPELVKNRRFFGNLKNILLHLVRRVTVYNFLFILLAILFFQLLQQDHIIRFLQMSNYLAV